MKKYILSSDQRLKLFHIIDSIMQNNYHKYYKQLGLTQERGGVNFHCVNKTAHNNEDSNPSLSIDNTSGQYHCHRCGEEGNFITYYNNYIKNSSGYDSYTDFIINFLKLEGLEILDDKIVEQIDKLYDDFVSKISANKPLNSVAVDHIKKEYIDKKELDRNYEKLLSNQDLLQYLKNSRNIDLSIIRKYKLGCDDRGRILFPMIDTWGNIVNFKAYYPLAKNKNEKWSMKYKGMGTYPSPINSLTENRIIFFEGEPDTYCALGFNIEGAFTLGSSDNIDIESILGNDMLKRTIPGKEIYICLDSDDAGRKASIKLAKIIYKYDPSILKIIDLNKSNINPCGLDPEAMKLVDGKNKRSEKDFTEYMQKNGFNDKARDYFLELIEKTSVYTDENNGVYKVTLKTIRSPEYFRKKVEVRANVNSVDDSSFLYEKNFIGKCPQIGNDIELFETCRRCVIPLIRDYKTLKELKFSFAESDEGFLTKKMSDSHILNMIEIEDFKKNIYLKDLFEINSKCKKFRFESGDQGKLIRIVLSNDTSQYHERKLDSDHNYQVEAYVINEDVSPNKNYKFIGMQTKSVVNQKAILLIDKINEKSNEIDSFKMDQTIHEMLKNFQPKNETIEEHLNRRYQVFQNEAALTGRTDMFELMDYAILSSIEIDNNFIPGNKRGYIEVLVCGDSRCGKSEAVKALMARYNVGELLTGGSSVTRSGILGGIKSYRNRNRISWGAFPANDMGLIVIDETSAMDSKLLEDLTPVRSDGIVKFDAIEKGMAPARVRKIFLSNPRGNFKIQQGVKGIDILMNVCVQKQVLSRFDAAMCVLNKDVPQIKTEYDHNHSDFNSYQCQLLLMWAYSRKPTDFVFEDGMKNYLGECQEQMFKIFHFETLLVNPEMYLKLLRMAISNALKLYSILPDDWSKVYVKKDHVKVAMDFLIRVYSSPNLRLHEYSLKLKGLEVLGDMRFMENIIQYIGADTILNESVYCREVILQIFFDYLDRVKRGTLSMVDAKDDSVKNSGYDIASGTQKLLSTLIARNCLCRTGSNSYTRTDVFTDWLEKKRNAKVCELSNILENMIDEEDILRSTGIIK